MHNDQQDKALTMNLDVTGGHGFSHTVDSLARVDARVVLPEAGDVQRHVAKVEGAAATRTCMESGVTICPSLTSSEAAQR